MRPTLHNPFLYISYITLIISLSISHLQAQEEINVVGNIQTIVDGSLSPMPIDRTDFGFAFVSGGTKIHSFTIENSGTSDLTISSIIGTGDFATIGVLTPSSPIPAGASATFTVTFTPSVIGLSTGTITINNSDADEAVYDFAVQGTGASTGMSTWDPLLYPPSPCSWTSQDNNTSNSPYASWNLAVQDAEAAGNNEIISLQPDAYVGSYDYDNANGNETCVGHQVATTLDANAAQNGLQILGSSGGCLTFIDLSSGSATDQWANFTNMNGLTIRNIYLRGWGGAITLTNCSNVLIEDCVFEDCDNAAVNAVFMTGCTNVTFRRCSFLGNDRSASRAIRVDNSGTLANRILFDECEFGCNASDSEGAAFMVGASSFVQINNTLFSGNRATSAGKGGAVNVAVGADAVFSNCDFIDNTASSVISSEGGGAIYVNGNSNGTQTTVLIDGCNFFENLGLGTNYGGAVICLGNSTDPTKSFTTIQNSIFERNGADRGGAFWASHARVIINNNYFEANQNASLSGNNSRGGGMYFQSNGGNYTITNNTFLNNLSSSGQIGRNATGCGACVPTVTGNNYNGQSQINLLNTGGGTAGWSLVPSSLAGIAPSYDCSGGSYCAMTLSGSCLSNSQSNFICSPSAANSGSIAGQVWEDADGDGIQEAGDNGIANAFVLLYDESAYLVGSMPADASGNYLFSNLLPGNYTVVFVNPSIPTYSYMSPANAPGSTEPTDSDQASQTIINGELRGATSSNIEVLASSAITDVDAGFTTIDLPVELANFYGKKESNKSKLYWTTHTEINNDFFSIQRSEDGMNWTTLDQITGAGTSTQTNYYEYVDQHPLQGVNYYQLTQYDFDGTSTTSQVIVLEHNGLLAYSLFPNPATDYVLLSTPNASIDLKSLSLINLAGKQLPITLSRFNQNLIKINLQDLEAGIYFISYEANGYLVQQKIVKL